MKTFFKVIQTYSEVTPESAECGDYSDHGFVIGFEEQQDLTIKEIIKVLNRYIGSYEIQNDGTSLTLTGSAFETVCYKTYTERQHTLRVEGSESNINRLIKILKAV